ncbi:hypothetical protein NQZ79_g4767 [Umbelopsis isabellina]|nr:hypothetical protein NQZ79_g4767 [Umbelopsis isabellina]
MRVKELPKKTALTPSTTVKAEKRIPRPSNCFIAYRMAIRELIVAGNPKMNGKKISQLAGKMWKSEPDYSPRKRKDSFLYDSFSSCEESYNNSILNNKKLRVSKRPVNLDESTPSKNEDMVCEKMITPKSDHKEADYHTDCIVQDNQRDQYELQNAATITLNPRETNVKQKYDTHALIVSELTYVENCRILTSSCDNGFPDELSPPYPTTRNLVSSKDLDLLQYSPYAYTPGYDFLYSYYVSES